MATGETEFIDNTTADVFIPEIWSKEAIIAREQALLMVPLVNRVFEKELKGFGDKVNVPDRSHLASRTKTISGNSAVTYETVTETMQTITVDTWEYAAIAIETATKVQVNRDMLAFYAPEMGYALALSVDDVLAGYIDNFSQTVGTLAQELTYEDVLRARQYLRDANAPIESTYIVISPAQEAGFLKLDQFIHRDYEKLQGDGATAKDKAYIGSWMRVPIYVSTNIEGSNAAGHDNGMFQKEALALIMQMSATTHTFFDIDYLAHKVVTEHLHGSKEMRDDHGVFMKGA